MPETITFRCGCSQEYTIPQERAGQGTKCPWCGADLMVPRARPKEEMPRWAVPAMVAAPLTLLVVVGGMFWWTSRPTATTPAPASHVPPPAPAPTPAGQDDLKAIPGLLERRER